MVFFNVTRWPSLLVFLFAGAVFSLFAFVTVNLFSQAMASLTFLREFGSEAVRHGALWQVGELILWGALSLSCWLAFKVCEGELVGRYQRWSTKTYHRGETNRSLSNMGEEEDASGV